MKLIFSIFLSSYFFVYLFLWSLLFYFPIWFPELELISIFFHLICYSLSPNNNKSFRFIGSILKSNENKFKSYVSFLIFFISYGFQYFLNLYISHLYYHLNYYYYKHDLQIELHQYFFLDYLNQIYCLYYLHLIFQL